MLVPENNMVKELSREVRLFAQKAAMSVIEVQPNINNVADIVVLLEILGYSKELVMKNGFNNLYSLANYIYDFIDVYENIDKNKENFLKSFTMPIPGIMRRVAEGIGMIFPWISSLVLLLLTGVSLWMAFGLPAQITTAFVIGIFLGLVITEGLLQVFGRLFAFYHEQTNLGEVKRLLKRSYFLISIILLITTAGLYTYGYFSHTPFELISITVISTTTISLHRASFMTIFALKKLTHLILAYSGAFTILLSVYFMASSLIQDAVTRYFVSLCAAFIVLSLFAIYHHRKITSANSSTKISSENPHFYKPPSKIYKTIKSRFSIQLWETLPNFLFGTFYFVLMFSDRIISWTLNPLNMNGIILPLGFNSAYHAGADLALVVLLPTSIIQYVMMAPVFMQINNLAIICEISDMKKMNQFVQNVYKKLVMVSIIISLITAVALNLLATQLIPYAEGTQNSMQVLRIASVGNVFLSIFSANSLFVMLLNRVKSLAIMTIISAMVVSLGGVFFGKFSFDSIAISYLAATALLATISTIYIKKIFKDVASIFFARYV